MENTVADSMIARLERAGIETIYPKGDYCPVKDVKLKFGNKIIKRPYADSCPDICKKHFGIDI